jgi:hypothetical protein
VDAKFPSLRKSLGKQDQRVHSILDLSVLLKCISFCSNKYCSRRCTSLAFACRYHPSVQPCRPAPRQPPDISFVCDSGLVHRGGKGARRVIKFSKPHPEQREPAGTARLPPASHYLDVEKWLIESPRWKKASRMQALVEWSPAHCFSTCICPGRLVL